MSIELPDPGAASYLRMHLPRLVKTLTLVTPASGPARALELGCYMQMTPALQMLLGFRDVRGAYLGPKGRTDTRQVEVRGRGVFRCEIDLFDAERDSFPYPDGHFQLVLACEIIEHLQWDPMHMLLEIRRVLAEGCTLILTTPNCASATSVARLLHGSGNPQIFSCYPGRSGRTGEAAPHVREYTAREIAAAVEAAGFEVESLFTEAIPGFEPLPWLTDLLERHGFDTRLRGEQTYCVAARRESRRVERYPSFLYVP